MPKLSSKGLHRYFEPLMAIAYWEISEGLGEKQGQFSKQAHSERFTCESPCLHARKRLHNSCKIAAASLFPAQICFYTQN